MPLINCSECDASVSDRAPACPRCGCPIVPTTIEATAKRWKVLRLLAVALFAVGVILFLAGQPVTYGAGRPEPIIPGGQTAGIVLAVLAFATAAYAKLGAWWHHG